MSPHSDKRGSDTGVGASRFVAIILASVILPFGCLFTWTEWRSAARALRDTMMSEALMLAASLDSDKVANLTGTARDLSSADYRGLRERLINIRNANPKYRYLYLMGKREGQLPFFYMGTAPEDSEDYSPPGQEYFEESPTLNQVFATGHPSLSPPFTDRWGTWVSALIPIGRAHDGASTIVFGMDHDAGTWRFEVARKAFVPAALTVLTIILMVASAEHLRRRQLSSSLAMLVRTEEALRETEAFRKRVFESSHIPIVVMESGTLKFIDCNPAAAQIFGFASVEETLGKTPLDVSAPLQYDGTPSQQQVPFYIEKALAEGLVVFEWRHKRPNGETWDAEVHLMSFLSGDKGLFQFTLDDITKRKRSDADRKRAEAERERLIAAIEQAAESVIITDSAGTIQYVNPAFESCTGYTREEAVGHNPRLLKSGEHDEAFYAEIWRTLETGFAWKGHIVNKRKDGTLFTEEATISPVRGTGGTVINYVCVSRDITHELALEAQYRQAQKMEAIGQLTGGVAHDFNNLLQVINGYTEMAMQDIEAEHPVRESLIEVARAGERASRLVSQLLIFSRRQIMQPHTMNLNAVIDDMLKMLRRVIGEHIQIEWFPDERLGVIHADRGMVEQALMNLCVNARDAMPEGGTLTIETQNTVIDHEYCSVHPWAKPGDYALLSVTDTGCGMSREVVSRIFEPFFTTKETGKGTGLGLATVYGIVKQHNGVITAYSEPGKGSVFRLRWQLCDGEAADFRHVMKQ